MIVVAVTGCRQLASQSTCVNESNSSSLTVQLDFIELKLTIVVIM